MNVVKPIAVAAALVAVLLAALSYLLSSPQAGLSEFISNLLLNVVAEFIGISAGLVVAVWLARRVAREKLSDLAEPILGLIQQLREDKKISPIAARKSVIATVSILADGTLHASRSHEPGSASRAKCRVCGLKSNVEAVGSQSRCGNCGLPGESWTTLPPSGEA